MDDGLVPVPLLVLLAPPLGLIFSRAAMHLLEASRLLCCLQDADPSSLGSLRIPLGTARWHEGTGAQHGKGRELPNLAL